MSTHRTNNRWITSSDSFIVTDEAEFTEVIESNWPVEVIPQETEKPLPDKQQKVRIRTTKGSWPLQTIIYQGERVQCNICPTIAKYLVPGEYTTLYSNCKDETYAEVAVIASDGTCEFGNIFSLATSLRMKLENRSSQSQPNNT